MSKIHSNGEYVEQSYSKLLKHGTTCSTELPALADFMKLDNIFLL